jgi:hypothetical protein
MLDLLQQERDAEIEETAELLKTYSFKELEKRSLAITKLFVKSVSTGVYGRVLVTFNRQSVSSGKLRIFSPGDIVGLYESGGGQQKITSAEGTVYRTSDEEVTVAFSEMQPYEEMKQPLTLALLANEITY